jgi:uncharacterized membrane protein YhhN
MPGAIGAELLGLFAVSAACDWFAVATGRKQLEYVFKPLTMLLLLYAVVGSSVVSSVEGPVLWLCLALLLSLAGDIFLMLPSDRFVPGLLSFLLAHVAYIVVFASYAVGLWWPAILFFAADAWAGPRILAGLTSSGRKRLRVPVMAYMGAITAMVLVVISTRSVWATAGAFLFFVSDTMIGWSRFVQPFNHDRLAIMVTYHLGQLGLVIGALGLSGP